MPSTEFPDTPQPNASAPQPIVDLRRRAQSAIPRRAQMWLMIGLAVGLLTIIVLTGNPPPSEHRTMPRSTPTPVDTQRVTGFQQQLALRERELARQLAALDTPAPPQAAGGPQIPDTPLKTTPVDPLADERRRREYHSLFASNVALTTRRGQERGAPDRDDRNVEGLDSEPRLAALEAQGRESLARLNASVSSLEQAARAPQSPQPQSQPIPAASPTDSAQRASSTPPIEPGGPVYRVLEGTVIEAALMTRLSGETASPVSCLVTAPLYSHSGEAILIPSGSKVLGSAKAVDAAGQRRLAVTFHRLILPDGAAYPLENFLGLNAVGDTGLKDRVNNHYLSAIGTAAAVGLISGYAQYLGASGLAGGNGDGDRTVVIAGAGVDNAAQSMTQVLSRYTNRLPTITIREGHRVRIYLTQDMHFPAYDDLRRRLASEGGL